MKGILLDENNEAIIEHGTMKIGDVRAQVAEHVITAFQGEFKEVPLLGRNAAKMLNGTPDPFWAAETKRQLKTQYVDADVSIDGDSNYYVELKNK
ncbi:MAG: hypothetical protein FWC34_11140 [Bacteroidetes bacterium]|nr:hypothetical protein [Bacteroidota bacterium]MCL2302903.1 hypothetical protein [Lentimicrobiaceae bacterium]